MKYAFLVGLKAGIRTGAQTLAGGLSALGVASVAGFSEVPDIALILFWGALLATLIAFFQNFAETLKYDEQELRDSTAYLTVLDTPTEE